MDILFAIGLDACYRGFMKDHVFLKVKSREYNGYTGQMVEIRLLLFIYAYNSINGCITERMLKRKVRSWTSDTNEFFQSGKTVWKLFKFELLNLDEKKRITLTPTGVKLVLHFEAYMQDYFSSEGRIRYYFVPDKY